MAENSGSQPPKPPLIEIKGDWQIKSSGNNVLDVGPHPEDTERIPLPPIEDVGVRAGTAENDRSTIPLPPNDSVQAKPIPPENGRTGGGAPPKQQEAVTKSPNSIKPPNFSQVTEFIGQFTQKPHKRTRTNSTSTTNR